MSNALGGVLRRSWSFVLCLIVLHAKVADNVVCYDVSFFTLLIMWCVTCCFSFASISR